MASARKQRLLWLLINTIDTTGEYGAESESEMEEERLKERSG
jgi:hypothetical protein